MSARSQNHKETQSLYVVSCALMEEGVTMVVSVYVFTVVNDFHSVKKISRLGSGCRNSASIVLEIASSSRCLAT